MMTPRRALLSVSDKTGLEALGRALVDAGTELVATGNTRAVLEAAGLKVTPIETITGLPEAFQGRMKTLSFHVCSGILYRRRDAKDEADLNALQIKPIDVVVVNFYPFEEWVKKDSGDRAALIEKIDIGGPTLVRAAAKNAPDVLVLTDPSQYGVVIESLKSAKSVSDAIANQCAAEAWDKVRSYDQAIAEQFGAARPKALRYGENPHQKAWLEVGENSPVAWDQALTDQELSYNNLLDLNSAYLLCAELKKLLPNHTGVVIVKHNNPCGVCFVPKEFEGAQKLALLRAWEGDPVSAFGGVLVFSDRLMDDSAAWLAERFVEAVAAPGLKGSAQLKAMVDKRKKLKAVEVRRFEWTEFEQSQLAVSDIMGGRLLQTKDLGLCESFQSVTERKFPEERFLLSWFGVAIARTLKSNALSIVREVPEIRGAYQLIGTGQGQPNRVEALEKLALPRAQALLARAGGRLSDAVLISDAFFPFRDTVDIAKNAGIKFIVQPGGSIKDGESITAANEANIAMAFTGVRHFKH